MNLLETLKTIVEYFKNNGGSGHTYTILNGVKSSKAILVTGSKKHGEILKKLASDIEPVGIFEIEKLNSPEMLMKPLVFDNWALSELLSHTVQRIDKLEKRIEDLTEEIKELKKDRSVQEATRGRMEQAKRFALMNFDHWNETTGFVIPHTSYYNEFCKVVEDAVDFGFGVAHDQSWKTIVKRIRED